MALAMLADVCDEGIYFNLIIMVQAILGAAAKTAVNGLINEFFNQRHVNQQIKGQKELMSYQNAINRQNLVDSPTLQVKGLSQAGLNPALAMGQQLSVPTSNGGTVHTERNNAIQDALIASQIDLAQSQAQDYKESARLKNIQSGTENARNLAQLYLSQMQALREQYSAAKSQAEKDLIQKDIDNYDRRLQYLLDNQESQTALNQSSAHYQDVQSEYIPYEQETKRISATASQTSANAAMSQAITAREQLELNKRLNTQQVEEIKQTINNLKTVNDKTKKEMELVVQQILSATSEAEIKKIQAEAKKRLGKNYNTFMQVWNDALSPISVGIFKTFK